MGFAESLAAEDAKGSEKTCGVCDWYETLEPEHQAAFERYAATPKRGYLVRMWRAAAQNGFSGSYSAFIMHVRNCRHGLR